MKHAPALLLALAVHAGIPAAALAQPVPRPQPAAPAAEAPGDAQIRKWVEDHPEEIIRSLNRYVEERKRRETAEADGKTAGFSAELFDATNAPILGNPDAKVTIAYVLDGECGYCKQMTPILDDFLARNPNVRIVHRWVKYLAPSSEYAARLAALVWRRYPQSYPTFYHAVMGHKGHLGEEGADKALEEAVGPDAALQLRAELRSGASRDEIGGTVQANTSLAQRAGIAGTPTFVVAGLGADGIIRGAVEPPRLKAAVDRALGVGHP